MKNLSKLKVSVILIVLLTVISCSKGDQVIDNEIDDAVIHVANTIKSVSYTHLTLPTICSV